MWNLFLILGYDIFSISFFFSNYWFYLFVCGIYVYMYVGFSGGKEGIKYFVVGVIGVCRLVF